MDHTINMSEVIIDAGPRILMGLSRLPARLNQVQTGAILGFKAHDIPVLVKARLLKPLGGGPRNSVKYFATVEIEQLSRDRKWLDRATAAISRSGSTRKVSPAVE